MSKRNDRFKAKEKKQKIVAAVGAVILLGLLAFQGPKTWKLLHPQAPETPVAEAAPPAPGAAVPLAPPTTAGGAPAPATGGGGGALTDSDPAPVAGQSQLLAFNRFVSKDPFVEQVKTENGVPVSAASPSAPAPKAPTAPRAQPAPVAAPTSSAGTGAVVPPAPPASTAKPTAATISVNGVAETVSLGKDFPQAQPIFHLVSLTRSSAKIAIAGGSFANGEPTLTLKLGKTITLMNTADGTRYEIKLVSLS